MRGEVGDVREEEVFLREELRSARHDPKIAQGRISGVAGPLC